MSPDSSPISSSALSGDDDANNWFGEEPWKNMLVHILIIRFMLSSFQDHFGLETSTHRSARLCLTDCHQDDDGCSEFRLFFCDCTHRQDSENGYQWQWRCVKIRITPDLTSRFLELEPSIIYQDGYESFFRLANQEDKKLSRQFVLRELRTQLADVEENEILHKAYLGSRTLRQYLTRAPGGSLGCAHCKLGLSCALTKALSFFHKTSMMPRPWTEDTIEFMCVRAQEHGEWIRGIFPQFPMISAPADPDPPEDDISVLTYRFAAQSLEGPKFPEIKALGVMLLQIWLQMPMAQLSRQYPGFFENGTVTRIGETALCHSLNTGILGHLPAELRPLCSIIEGCFDDEVFEERTNQEIDRIIYHRFFEPLEELKTA